MAVSEVPLLLWHAFPSIWYLVPPVIENLASGPGSGSNQSGAASNQSGSSSDDTPSAPPSPSAPVQDLLDDASGASSSPVVDPTGDNSTNGDINMSSASTSGQRLLEDSTVADTTSAVDTVEDETVYEDATSCSPAAGQGPATSATYVVDPSNDVENSNHV